MKELEDKSQRLAGMWMQKGFSDFIQGTFGNAGQNIYVSKAGVLQRINCYDFNSDGYFDLIFCNSQNHWEKPPAYVYIDPLGDRRLLELPSDGAWSAAVADLDGDGYDDLVLAVKYNGVSFNLNSFIYYGSPDGFTEAYHHRLPAPNCTSVAIGDFNGDGKPDIAFISNDHLRVFYQSHLGFEPKRFVDFDIEGVQLIAEDLDGDGYHDLLVRRESGEIIIYWGNINGIDAKCSFCLPIDEDIIEKQDGRTPFEKQYAEYVPDASPLVKIIGLNHTHYIFVAREELVYLVPATGRSFGTPLILQCPNALSIAVGDINGDGYQDIALACRQPSGDGECSWIYWGSPDGYSENRRTELKSYRACDVAIGDLDANGYDDVILCQSHTSESFTTDSLVYRGSGDGIVVEPISLTSHDARRVLLARPSSDEKPQVIFANYFSRDLIGNVDASIYFGSPEGYSADRKKDIAGWGAVEAACCDINDDGLVDLVLANASENSISRDPGSYLFYNTPNGFPHNPDLRLPTTRAHGVCCADINHDGYLDLIFCGFNNPDILVLYGTANGFNTDNPVKIRLEHEGIVYSEPRWIYLADLNNDGWLDLVVPQISKERSIILWGSPSGFSMERKQMLPVLNGACARAADLNGNGYLDLIIGGHMPSPSGPHDSFIYIYWNGPDGLKENRRTLLPANTVNALTIADFNNDGLLDIFICSYHDGKVRDIDSYIYWNRKDKGFSAADRSRLFTHSSSGCVACDFNEDGWVDLAIAYHKVYGDHKGYSAVWWNGPDGFSEERVTKLPTSGPHGMTSAGPGNIVDRGPEEYYTSPPFELPEGVNTIAISWEATIPAKTWVHAQLRSGNTKESLGSALWEGPSETKTRFDKGDMTSISEANRWIQYKLILGATNSLSTPRVTEVEIHFFNRWLHDER